MFKSKIFRLGRIRKCVIKNLSIKDCKITFFHPYILYTHNTYLHHIITNSKHTLTAHYNLYSLSTCITIGILSRLLFDLINLHDYQSEFPTVVRFNKLFGLPNK